MFPPVDRSDTTHPDGDDSELYAEYARAYGCELARTLDVSHEHHTLAITLLAYLASDEIVRQEFQAYFVPADMPRLASRLRTLPAFFSSYPPSVLYVIRRAVAEFLGETVPPFHTEKEVSERAEGLLRGLSNGGAYPLLLYYLGYQIETSEVQAIIQRKLAGDVNLCRSIVAHGADILDGAEDEFTGDLALALVQDLGRYNKSRVVQAIVEEVSH